MNRLGMNEEHVDAENTYSSMLNDVTFREHFCSDYVPPFLSVLCAVDSDIDAVVQCRLNLIGSAHATTSNRPLSFFFAGDD